MDFLPAPLQVLLENLVSLAVREGESLFSADDNLKKLERTCLRVQGFVQEAKENYNQVTGDEAYKLWLRDLEDAAYDAEDLLDEIEIELSMRPEENRSNKNQVRNLVLSSLKLTAPRTIEKILNRMNNLVKELASSSVLGPIVPAGMKVATDENILQTCSLMDEHPIFGREDDASKIIRMLIGMDEPKGDNVSIVPIVGMAGVGKTTLAKFIYNDRRVAGHFDSKIWLSESSSFNVEKIMRNILAATANDEESCNQIRALDRLIQVKLANRLSGKKLLLVLDGLQEVNQGELELLLNVLRISATEEGVILITTRSHVIFSTASEKNTYYLKPLPEEDCWALLAEIALKNIVADEAKNLVSIGREIAKKCRGLPWAAKILGSIMQARMNENEWMAILESNMWDLPEVPRNVFLRSHHIPTHLKRCFSYCAIFPQDYEFSKDKLVKMWMAEGFIIPEGVRRVEDIGEKYFDNLLSMSIFQYDCRKYKMHNLIQSLAQSISGVICLRFDSNEGMQTSNPSIGYARHLAMSCEHNEITALKTLFRCKGVRTLLLLREYGMCIKEVPFHMFIKWCRLRVLDLSGTHISNLADNLGNLMHLRYLDLSNTHIRWLPETVGKVFKLQTLILRNCLYFRQLPECTKNLINLRHLELEGSQLMSMPYGIGNLTNLQTLKEFIVSGRGARLSEIKGITSIQGSICIKKLENVREEETLETVLENKKFLHSLELQWSDMQDEGVQMEVLESLQPHENLKELKIRKYSGRTFPSWVGSTLYSNLVSFHLLECRNCDILPPLSQLPMLKSLEIAEMLMVESIDSIFCGNGVRFPSLETLKLKDMPKLRRWDGFQENDMPLLCKLIIDTCPQLTHLSSLHHFPSLNELQLIRCYGLSMLPEEGLPRDLHSLIIIDCPLMSGCGRGGEYWHMIENIPYKEILI